MGRLALLPLQPLATGEREAAAAYHAIGDRRIGVRAVCGAGAGVKLTAANQQHMAWLAMDARRRAKRRAQWRDSKRRAYARKKASGLVGWLHELRCHTREHKGNRYCVPIPVYAP